MSRHERRAAEAKARKAPRANTSPFEDLWTGAVPDDVKRDTAKVVRSVDWENSE